MNQKAYLKQINAMLQGRKIVKVEYMRKKILRQTIGIHRPLSYQ